MIVLLNAVERWDRNIDRARNAAHDNVLGLQGLLGSLAQILGNLMEAQR